MTIDPSIPPDFIDTHGVPMRLIPEGVFTMGSNNGNADERPIHKVYLDAFYIDKYEVTNTLYKACVDVGVCKSPKDESSDKHPDYYNNAQYANYPVINIDWDMAMAYCEWRGEQLPTEAQWEKAARGTDARTYPWGEEIDIYHANYRFPYGATKSVGSYENGRSPYGTYDMAGNVWEWVNDWYDGTYYSTLKDGIENPIGPDTGKTHVLRGGSWADEGSNLRTAFRYGLNPSLLNGDIGFRCVGDASP